MATAKDVAERAGTSTAVVSYVFNDGPRSVSPTTRERVLLAASELNYHPNAAARALTMGRSDSFGLIVPSIQNPFFGELSHAVEMAAKEAGHLLLIADSAMDPAQEKQQIDAFIGRRVDGIILISCARDQDLSLVISNGIPVVALHPILNGVDVQTVHMDYLNAARDLTLHLLTVHKVKSILMVTAKFVEGGAKDHRQGVKAAIKSEGKKVELLEIQSEVSRGDASSEVLTFLKQNKIPDAIYCSTDEQAYGVLSALHKLGINVPGDVRVVGFDGTLHSKFSIPPLTTVRQPLEMIAQIAIQLLSGDEPGINHKNSLKGELVIRESCGC